MDLKQATADELSAYNYYDATQALNRVRDILREVDTDFMLFEAAVVGSTYINGFGSDIDIVVWCPSFEDSSEDVERLHYILGAFLGAVLDCDGGEYGIGADGWCSMHIPDSGINLLVCSPSIAESWRRAAEACRYVVEKTGEPMPKEERVELHRIIMGM